MNPEKAFPFIRKNELWENAIMIEICPSSGAFGSGYIRVFSKSGAVHIALFSEMGINGWWELEKIHPLFARKEGSSGTRRPYLAEENGWTYIEKECLLIRDVFWDTFSAIYTVESQKPENKVRCIDIADMVSRALRL